MWNLILGGVGAVLGYVLAPYTFGTSYAASMAVAGWAIGSTIGAYISADTVITKGPRIDDLKLQVSGYGVDIPIVYGTVRIAGNVFWSTDLIEQRKIRHLDGDAEYWEYYYYANFAVGLCGNEIIGVRRIWLDGKLYESFDDTIGTSFSLLASIQRGQNVTIYKGTETQTADPTIASTLGTANTCAYRGLSYMVFNDLRLDNYGNRIPEVTCEVVANGTINTDPYEFTLTHGADGITISPEGNMIICNDTDDTIYVYEGISDTLITSFIGPWDDTAYVRDVAIYNGDLYVLYSMAAQAYVSWHKGISPNIYHVFEVEEGTGASALLLYNGYAYITGGTQDLNRYIFYRDYTPWVKIAEVAALTTSASGLSIDGSGRLIESSLYSGIRRRDSLLGPQYDSLAINGKAIYYDRNSNYLYTVSVTDILATVTIYDGFTTTKLQQNTITKEDASLSDVVEDICDRVDIAAADIDTTSIADETVKGYVVASVMPARRALEPLLAANQFDGAEIDHKLKFIKRGGIDFTETCETGQTIGDKWDTLTYSYGTSFTYSTNTIEADNTASASRSYGGNCITDNSFVLFKSKISIKFWFKSSNDWWNDNLDLSEAKIEIVPIDPVSRQQNDFEELEEGGAGNGAKLSLNLRTNASGKITLREYYGGSATTLLNEDFTYDHTNGNSFELVVDTYNCWAKLYNYSGTQIGATVDLNENVYSTIGSKFRFNLHWHNWGVQRQVYWDNIEIDGLTIIPEEDLAAHEYGSEPPKKINISRMQESELPREVSLQFLSDDMDYQHAGARSTRMSLKNTNTSKFEFPIVMSLDKGKQVAEILHNTICTERTHYKFQTYIKYIFLAPTDSIQVDGYRARVASMNMSSNLLEMEAPAETNENYTSAATSGDPAFSDQVITTEGTTNYQLLDMPILSDLHDDAGFYIAVYGLSSGWIGAQVYKSSDGGSSYVQTLSIFEASTVAYTTDALDDAACNVWDRTSTVTVRLATANMSLSSKTEAQVLSRQNWAAIGTPDEWEIIGFANVTDNLDGTYTLDTFLRGLRGTEFNTANHAADDVFVLLDMDIAITDPGATTRYTLAASTIGVEQYLKIISLHANPQMYTGITFTNTAIGLKPYAPADVRGSRDGSNNLTITWKRSGRLSNGWDDYQDVPLGEDSEAYEVDIYDTDDGSFGTVLTTLEVSAETASLPATTQSNLGITPGDSIDLKVYQISAIVDRGYARGETV